MQVRCQKSTGITLTSFHDVRTFGQRTCYISRVSSARAPNQTRKRLEHVVVEVRLAGVLADVTQLDGESRYEMLDEAGR